MFSTRFIWRTVGLAALLSTLICIFGFVYAVNQIIYPKPAVSTETQAPAETEKPDSPPMADKDKINIVALGDSLTAGTGDLTGRGYVGQTKEMLADRLGKPVYVLNNFAIPGYRTTDLLKDMDANKGIGTAVSEADIVLLTIGANDLFQGGQDIFSGESDEGFNPGAGVGRMPAAMQRLEQIIDRLHQYNPNAIICYVGLYHPFLDIDTKRDGGPIIQQWNSEAFQLANRYSHVIVVPTYDLFELNLSRYLYTDHFHPNQDGYARIAERIAQIVH
ncbi:GDSL-type esterase/lipase family protein [Paenibacillus xerothermodurans]|uniref:Lipase n=1 Tax=Paenibacillus xerothermodurans TaxID=1977292 RepID=A0A2W1NQW8_PAEXE|nr:GDSL-type esterase/lipase family protein [Paenibacillus xerothermodurans]PZE21895.1 lipase [Paenibacillus xerothermodurans]